MFIWQKFKLNLEFLIEIAFVHQGKVWFKVFSIF